MKFTLTLATPQEELQSAMGEAEVPVEVPEDEASEAESSASSAFGVVPKEKKTKVPASAPGPKQGKGTDEAKDKLKKDSTGEKLQKLLGRAKSAVSSLESIVPLHVWQGSVKVKDLQSRMSKASEVAHKLDSQEFGEEAKSKSLELLNQVETQEKLLDFFGSIDFEDSMCNTLPKIDGSLLDMFASLPADCLTAVLSDVGRKILEDRTSHVSMRPTSLC